MIKIEFPSPRFTKWCKWSDREKLEGVNYPGVYLIAITNKKIENSYPDWYDVVYIGMSVSKGGLKSRWRGFDRSIRGMRGHSGARRIFGKYGDYSNWKKKLYVAKMSLECNTLNPTAIDYTTMGVVAFLEYRAFARYFRKAGGHPEFNIR